jgi:calcineurin-like phosphoesterase family protein
MKDAILAADWHDCGELHTLNVPPESNNGVGQKIILCHYAMKVWNESHHGTWQLYGHSHGSLPEDPNARQTDVGVDSWNYTPVSMEQLNILMAKKKWKPIDRHGTD